MNKPLRAAGGLLAHLLRGVGADAQRKGGGVSQIPLRGLHITLIFNRRHHGGSRGNQPVFPAQVRGPIPAAAAI